MACIRRYQPKKKLISKISVDSIFRDVRGHLQKTKEKQRKIYINAKYGLKSKEKAEIFAPDNFEKQGYQLKWGTLPALNFTFSSYSWLCVFHCSHGLLVYETFCENCAHFILKWLQPNSFGEVCFLEESYENVQKFLIFRGAGKARFNVATPTNATVTCTAYVLPYNFQTKSI